MHEENHRKTEFYLQITSCKMSTNILLIHAHMYALMLTSPYYMNQNNRQN